MRKGISYASDATAPVNVNSAIPQKEVTVSETDICNAGYVIRQDTLCAEPIIRVTEPPSDVTEADTCLTALYALYVTAKDGIPVMSAAEQVYLSANADSRGSPANALSVTVPVGDSSIQPVYAITPLPYIPQTVQP
jgi:hypothetical protein